MDKNWIWFSRINKIGAKTQKNLLERYNTPEKIWKLKKEELQKNNFLNEEQIKIILENGYRENLQLYEEFMKKKNIKMITIRDKEYPNKLRNIYDPPVVLFAMGNIEILNEPSIAIIGSRMCSEYGKNIARQFAYNLSKHNINIISGLAKGIDTYAHFGAISANKKTIAVIGSGLDVIYPKENVSIAEKIVQSNGAIISEYIVGTRPERMNFPARNRIISGLSDGVLVVEANRKEWNFYYCRFCNREWKEYLCNSRRYKQKHF